jgi:nitrite reductase/ring-hydroxylating ferredoxin subunit
MEPRLLDPRTMAKQQPQDLSLEDLPPCKGGISRRGFCVVAGTGLITLGLPGCDPGGSRVEVGGLGGDAPAGTGGNGGGGGGVGGGPTGQDMANGSTGGQDAGTHDGSTGGQDSGTTGQDSGTTNSCSGPLNAGAASAIASGAAKHFTDNINYDLYVVRDSGGLYAINASCPHAGCTTTYKTTSWYCNCHGATWDANGNNPTSPAHSALEHYSVCIDGSGNVLVDYNKTVTYTTRV